MNVFQFCTFVLVFSAFSNPLQAGPLNCSGKTGTDLETCNAYNSGYDVGFQAGKSGSGTGINEFVPFRKYYMSPISGSTNSYLYVPSTPAGGGSFHIGPNYKDAIARAMKAVGSESGWGAVPKWDQSTSGGDVFLLPRSFDPTNSEAIRQLKEVYRIGQPDGPLALTIVPFGSKSDFTATEFYNLDSTDTVARMTNFNALKGLQVQSIYGPSGG